MGDEEGVVVGSEMRTEAEERGEEGCRRDREEGPPERGGWSTEEEKRGEGGRREEEEEEVQRR